MCVHVVPLACASFHGDDGGIFHAAWSMRRPFGARFGKTGDVIGCGVRPDLAPEGVPLEAMRELRWPMEAPVAGRGRGGGGSPVFLNGGGAEGSLGGVSIFFTLNGVYLGEAFRGVYSGPLYPSVGADAAVQLEFNFGLEGDPPFSWNEHAEAGV
jgi:hypothetical protein